MYWRGGKIILSRAGRIAAICLAVCLAWNPFTAAANPARRPSASPSSSSAAALSQRDSGNIRVANGEPILGHARAAGPGFFGRRFEQNYLPGGSRMPVIIDFREQPPAEVENFSSRVVAVQPRRPQAAFPAPTLAAFMAEMRQRELAEASTSNPDDNAANDAAVEEQQGQAELAPDSDQWPNWESALVGPVAVDEPAESGDSVAGVFPEAVFPRPYERGVPRERLLLFFPVEMGSGIQGEIVVPLETRRSAIFSHPMTPVLRSSATIRQVP